MRSGHVFRAGFDVTVRQMMSSKRLCECFDERGEERERESGRESVEVSVKHTSAEAGRNT